MQIAKGNNIAAAGNQRGYAATMPVTEVNHAGLGVELKHPIMGAVWIKAVDLTPGCHGTVDMLLDSELDFVQDVAVRQA